MEGVMDDASSACAAREICDFGGFSNRTERFLILSFKNRLMLIDRRAFFDHFVS